MHKINLTPYFKLPYIYKRETLLDLGLYACRITKSHSTFLYIPKTNPSKKLFNEIYELTEQIVQNDIPAYREIARRLSNDGFALSAQVAHKGTISDLYESSLVSSVAWLAKAGSEPYKTQEYIEYVIQDVASYCVYSLKDDKLYYKSNQYDDKDVDVTQDETNMIYRRCKRYFIYKILEDEIV